MHVPNVQFMLYSYIYAQPPLNGLARAPRCQNYNSYSFSITNILDSLRLIKLCTMDSHVTHQRTIDFETGSWRQIYIHSCVYTSLAWSVSEAILRHGVHIHQLEGLYSHMDTEAMASIYLHACMCACTHACDHECMHSCAYTNCHSRNVPTETAWTWQWEWTHSKCVRIIIRVAGPYLQCLCGYNFV